MAFEPDEPEVPTGRFVPDGTAAAPAVGNSTLPANAGLAKLLTGVAGLPVDTIQNILNFGLAGVGTALTAGGRPDLAPDLIQGSVGGSADLQNRLRATEMPGLSPDNPTPDSPVGTAQYDFVARGGVLPGGALPAAGSMIAEKIGGPEWAGVGSMLPSAVRAARNEIRAPQLAKAQVRNATRDATLKEAQEAGYVVPQSAVNPSFLSNRVESFAGKDALKQDAQIRNQQVTNALARKAVEIADDVPITPGLLKTKRTEFSEPYRQVSSLSPIAKAALEKLKEARAETNAWYKSYDRSAHPVHLKRAQRLEQRADTLEAVLEREAKRAGKPDLIAKLRESRQKIAKTYDVERALNVGDSNVSANLIGNMIDRGKPLSAELATIGKFDQAFRPFNREAGMVPAPGVSALEPLAMTGYGLGGAAVLGPGGLVAGAIPLARPSVRSMMLSDIYQRNFARPDYSPGAMPENNIQSLARLAVLAQQQQEGQR
jgi:hypothetical protein